MLNRLPILQSFIYLIVNFIGGLVESRGICTYKSASFVLLPLPFPCKQIYIGVPILALYCKNGLFIFRPNSYSVFN